MRLLVLGGEGMLGHQICRQLGSRHETWATYRRDPLPWLKYGKVNAHRALGGVDASDFSSVERALDAARPAVVINAVGIVKQRDDARLAIPSIMINALLPHKLAEACARRNARLIHMSTDCVFSGTRGGYSEDDVPDPLDLYGRSKLYNPLRRHSSLGYKSP